MAAIGDFELSRGATVPVYSLGERRVEFRGERWYIAPDATVIGSVAIENEASVWFKVVIRGDSDLITIGERVNVQDATVLHTDAGIKLTLGRNVSIGHLAMLHGCTVGEGSLIGIGAVILNHAVIGKHTLIGANTLIPEGKRIPDGVLVVGQPGKVVRDLKPAEIDGLLTIADGYVARAEEYRQRLKPTQI
jgi:carbonic anhydrase/acetyltransferase-like protein (isoleucine patch superfamily)